MAASREKITIPNAVGEKIVGVLHDARFKELVIICHGLNSSKDCELVANLANHLEQRGLSSFRFDFSGNGESDGNFEFGCYSKEVDDIHSVVQYWISRGWKVNAVIGHSKGGSTVLLYAAKYKEVDTIVNASGRLDLNEGLKEQFGGDFFKKIEIDGFLDVKSSSGHGRPEIRITRESLMERLSTDLRKAASEIPDHVRVLSIHGSDDKTVDMKNSLECDKIIANHTLQIIDGADHLYSQHEREFADALFKFIQAHP